MAIPIGTDHPLERTPWATISIILITILSQYLDLGTGEWLIPIPIFQHAGFWHLFFNMLYLWIFGSYLEAKVGWLRFVFFYFLCEMGSEFVFSVLMGGNGIGASGAISGIMALYLVRFYHARIRVIFWLGIFTIRYNVPVMFFIPLWFAKNLAFGLLGVSEFTSVAYFAHIGGFLTGLIIAKLFKFDAEGQAEYFKLRAARTMAGAEDPGSVLPDLHRALEADYDDPEIHLLLGRYYSRFSDRLRLAEKYYLQAIDRYTRGAGDPLAGAGVFQEMVKKCGGVSSPEEYLKYAAVFERADDHEGAAALLSQAMDRDDLSGETGKKVLLKLFKNACISGNEGLAARARERFEGLFPGVMMPQPDTGKTETLVLPISKEQVGRRKPAFWTWLNEMMNSRMFWLVWTIIFLPVAIATSLSLFEVLGDASFLAAILAPTLIAAGMTHFYLNSGETAGRMLYGGYRKPALQAQRDYNISTYFQKGMAAERDENFEDAVTYFKGVLAEDPKHIEARFRLARIYHRNIVRKGSAIFEYEKLMELLPEGAPYYRAAKEAVEELRGKRPVPEPIRPLEWRG